MTTDKEVENTISNLGLNLEWEGEPIITFREVLCHLMYYCKWMGLDWDFEKFCAEIHLGKKQILYTIIQNN